MSDVWGGVLFLLFLYFGAPIALAKLVLRASWRQVGTAYLIWFAMLALFGLSALPSATVEEATGWPIIMGMFLTIPAIVVIVLVLKIVAAVRKSRG
jgi:ABC-type polysaccharide transport system permease subunit